MIVEKNSLDASGESDNSLRLSQRIESTSQLTEGLVHDLNNSLQSIVAALELVRKLIAAGRGNETERFIVNAIGAARGAAALNNSVLNFSSRRPTQPGPVSMNEVMVGMENIVRRSLPRSINLVLELSKDLWESYCDVEQAEVAVLNLIIHARDAIPNGGIITIRTYNTDTSSLATGHAANVPPGEYACLLIEHIPSAINSSAMKKSPAPPPAEIGSLKRKGRFMLAAQFAHRNSGDAQIAANIGGGSSVVIYLPRHIR